MAYEVTATRKRPQRFEDLVGQEFVVSTLKNAIEQGRIAHAYLFSGPRGVGKTTSARLLAKALNCVHGPTAEPCGQCDNCLSIAKGSSMDVIEIDGASNTGVNDVRAIKEEVMFPPTSSRFKIYIIDEVHMLSQSAFNALLKTIEEPPEYVVFIFATTETQKVPATIRSRCQQFNFQLIPLETIQSLLAQTATEMGITAEPEALEWIAKESTGSMRDAYTLFDQVVAFSNGALTLAQIQEKMGVVGVRRINPIMEDVLAQRPDQVLNKVHALLSQGISIEQIIKDFADYFRTLLLIKNGIKSENILGEKEESFPLTIRQAYTMEQLEAALDMFLTLYRDIRFSLNPRFELELAISKLSKLRYVASTASILEQIARLKNDLISGTITPLNPALASQPTIQPATPVAVEPTSAAPTTVAPAPVEKPVAETPAAMTEAPTTVEKPVAVTPATTTEAPTAVERPVAVTPATTTEAPLTATVEPVADAPTSAAPASATTESTPTSASPSSVSQGSADQTGASQANTSSTGAADVAGASVDSSTTTARPGGQDSVPPTTAPKKVWSKEELEDVLPHGTVSVESTNDGLILTFTSRFFFQVANKDIDSLRQKLRNKTGNHDLNVVLTFSESTTSAEGSATGVAKSTAGSATQATTAKVAPVVDERPVADSVAAGPRSGNSGLGEREAAKTNLVRDLILCFDGREEK